MSKVVSGKNFNLALLLASFAFAQGSLFLSQTYLIANAFADLVGQYATSYAVVFLSYQIVDWGSHLYLSRETLERDGDTHGLARTYWDLSLFRLAVAACVGGIFVTGSLLPNSGFLGAYLLGAVPGVFFFAFNATGIFDGSFRSGWAGMATSLPIMASAVVLPLASAYEPQVGGALMGAAYSLGSAASVILQIAILRWFGLLLPPGDFSLSRSLRSGVRCAVFLFTALPGQIFFRSQIFLSAIMFGPAVTGQFVYAKQLVSGLTQMLWFHRRTDVGEFRRRTLERTQSLVRFLWAETNVRASLALSVAFTIGCLVAWHVAPQEFRASALIGAALGPTIVLISILVSLTQAVAYLGAESSAALIANAGTGGSLATTYALSIWIGPLAIPIAEALGQIVQCMLLGRTLLRATDRHRARRD